MPRDHLPVLLALGITSALRWRHALDVLSHGQTAAEYSRDRWLSRTVLDARE